ncbi:hypothetical protein GS458_1415 [Geobacillus stearothermophilus]|nr:hypothetical protein GS458_1415 [Geobacillus stearothermophilus]
MINYFFLFNVRFFIKNRFSSAAFHGILLVTESRCLTHIIARIRLASLYQPTVNRLTMSGNVKGGGHGRLAPSFCLGLKDIA